MQLFTIRNNTYEKIANILQTKSDAIDVDVQIIKKWLDTQCHLPEVMEDNKIKNFLLMNKLSIERTKQKIDLYYSIRSIIPDIFEKSNPNTNTMIQFMKMTYCCLHPKLVDDLYRVYLIKPKMQNKLMVKETGLQCININEVRLYEDVMFGDIVIFDMINTTLGDLTAVTPTLMAKLVGVYEKVFSLRVKQILIINSPSYAIRLVNIIRSLVKPKIFNRIEICSGTDILQKVFSTADLPSDYGGSGSSLDELNDLTMQKLYEFQDRFNKLDVLKVNEALRPEKLDNDSTLGFYGNFKTLNVD